MTKREEPEGVGGPQSRRSALPGHLDRSGVEKGRGLSAEEWPDRGSVHADALGGHVHAEPCQASS